MAGLCHTVISFGYSIALWALDFAGVPPQQVEELLQLVGSSSARAVLLRETSVAAGGVSRRQQHQRDRDVYYKEPTAQSPRGPPGRRAVYRCQGVGEPGGLRRREVGDHLTGIVVLACSVGG